MMVANKLEPEIKAKRLKLSLGIDQSNFKSKTLQLLVPNSKRLGGYTGDTQERKRVVYRAQKKARQALDRSRKVVNTKIYI